MTTCHNSSQLTHRKRLKQTLSKIIIKKSIKVRIKRIWETLKCENAIKLLNNTIIKGDKIK